MFGIFKRRSLEDVLTETKKVKIQGVIFHIKKFNPLDYLDGSQVMQKIFDEYQAGGDKIDSLSSKKIRDHFRDVIMSGVDKPKLSRKEDGEGVFVDEILNNWEMTNALYEKIWEYNYGKKKL